MTFYLDGGALNWINNISKGDLHMVSKDLPPSCSCRCHFVNCCDVQKIICFLVVRIVYFAFCLLLGVTWGKLFPIENSKAFSLCFLDGILGFQDWYLIFLLFWSEYYQWCPDCFCSSRSFQVSYISQLFKNIFVWNPVGIVIVIAFNL